MPALATPPDAVLYQKDTIARPLMDIASVAQTVTCMMTAVKMPTVLQVVNINLLPIASVNCFNCFDQ